MSDEQTTFIEDSAPVDDAPAADVVETSTESTTLAPDDNAPRVFPTSDAAPPIAAGDGTDAAPAVPSLKEVLAARGLPVPDDADDDAIADQLKGLIQKAQYLPQLEAYARKYYEVASDQRYQAYLQSQQQGGDPSPAPPAKVEQVPKSQRPEFDPDWLNLVKRDENGLLVPISSGVDPTLPQKIETYKKWATQQQQKWIDRDPEEFETQVYSKAQEYVDTKLREFHENMARQSVVQQTVAQNSTWAHVKDQKTGQLIYNPITGSPELTPAGNLYIQTVETLAQNGVTDIQVQDILAKHVVRGMLAGMAPPAQPIAQQPTKQEKQQPFRQAVTGRQPNRSGTFTASNGPGDMAQDPSQSFLEMAMSEARRRGIVPSTT